MTQCTEAGCGGTIAPDGYCDTCGVRATPAGPGHSAAPAPAPSAGAQAGAACSVSGCGGAIAADGYCDTCGTRARPGVSGDAGSPAASQYAEAPSIAAPTAPGRSAAVSAGVSRRTSSSRRTGTTRRLGAGLVEIAPTPSGDPADAVMSAEKIQAVLGVVPEDERFCSSCGQPVGRTIDDRPGRVAGFCSNCRTPFDFHTNSPSLAAGDTVAGQYEVLGPIAHGGMGWIYLARDRAVSDRWVVLKGLLNEDDPDAAAAAVAERQFLAQIEHGNIVNIYNFVTHRGRGYIVMEYVGGASLNSKLKQRRRENGGVPDPLPVDQATAYVLGILPAFGYLHGLGLVYNDLKPANIMSVGDDVKLIDVGAVMRIDDPDAAIFGTPGFQAPEVASMGPSVSSDLYTVGRTLAVLILDFVFHTGTHEHSIPPPKSYGLLRQWESLHRFLLKSTAEHPDDRFQAASAMAEQLTGILREVVAVAQKAPRPVHSRLFGGDRLAALLLEGADEVAQRPDWRTLPAVKADPDDAASAYLEDLAELDPGPASELLAEGLRDGSLTDTAEVKLFRARAAIAAGQPPDAPLADLATADPWDWRGPWLRSVHALARGEAAAAAEGFSAVWTELPGELAPRLGVALAAEQAGEYDRAAELYERVIAVDNSYVTAAFGLARCRAALGDRPGAVEAYRRVPPSSAMYADAQVASARAMVTSTDTPAVDDLETAARTVERLQLDAQERAALAAEILERALAARQAGATAAPDVTLFGHSLDERGLRKGLESTYRELARLETNPREKFRLVDRANAVRPRTLL